MRPAAAARRGLALTLALVVGAFGGAALGSVVQGDPGEVRVDPADLAPTGPDVETPPELEPVIPDTLLAWIPGGLPTGFASRVAALPGVRRVVPVVSGIAWMTRSVTSGGAIVDDPGGGRALPLEVAAATLTDYAPFLAPADRSLIPRLAAGEAALGSTSAEIRRIDVGGTLEMGPDELLVAGVLPDTAIGAHELFVSRATASSLGLTRERYVLIDPADGASREAITAGIRATLPAGALIQIRGPGETPFFRQGDAVLPQVQMKLLLGEFSARPVGGYLDADPAWTGKSIVTTDVPLLGTVRCNRALIPQLAGALLELQREGLGHLVNPGHYGGCFSARFINRNPAAGISHHSWGAAIDINVAENPFGHTPHQDPRLVAIFERWGFTWGGRWILPDGMHFEFVRFAP